MIEQGLENRNTDSVQFLGKIVRLLSNLKGAETKYGGMWLRDIGLRDIELILEKL